MVMIEQIPSGEEDAKGPIFQILCQGASGRSKPIPAFVEVVQCATGTYKKCSESYVLCPRFIAFQLGPRYDMGCHEGNPLPEGYDYDALAETVEKEIRACPYFKPRENVAGYTVSGPATYSAMLPGREPQEPKPEKPPKPQLYKTPLIDGIVSALFPTYYQLRVREMRESSETR